MAKRKLVSTSTLKRGMKIEQAIVDAHGHEMIARGMVLDDFQIEYLKDHGVAVYINDGESDEVDIMRIMVGSSCPSISSFRRLSSIL